MSDTYCGKSCGECKFKEKLSCPGCKAGPGAPYYGDCEIAKCCREKGHEDCSTCTDRIYCTMLKRRSHMPEDRIERLALKAEQDAKNAARAPFLGKWIGILFWLIIPSIIASAMGSLSEVLPFLSLPGTVLNIAVSIAYGSILIVLSRENSRYRIAGICSLVTTVISAVTDLLFGDSIWIPLLGSIVVAAVSIIGTYHEISAHSEVTSGIDSELSEKWDKLMRWYIIALVSALGGIIIPVIGILIALAAVIVIIVVSICKLVYLYRTAKAFNEYT